MASPRSSKARSITGMVSSPSARVVSGDQGVQLLGDLPPQRLRLQDDRLGPETQDPMLDLLDPGDPELRQDTAVGLRRQLLAFVPPRLLDVTRRIGAEVNLDLGRLAVAPVDPERRGHMVRQVEVLRASECGR